MLKKFYDYEALQGSVIKGVFSKASKTRRGRSVEQQSSFLNSALHLLAEYSSEVREGVLFPDLTTMRGDFKGYSVWRVRNGLEELTDRIRHNLPTDKFKLLTNESVKSLEFGDDAVKVSTDRQQYDADLVISALNSKRKASLGQPLVSAEFDYLGGFVLFRLGKPSAQQSFDSERAARLDSNC